MNSDLSVLAETGRKFSLLAQTLERRTADSVQAQQQALESQRQVAAKVRADVSQLVQNAGDQVVETVRIGVASALDNGAERYDRTVETASNRLDQATQQFQLAANTVLTDARHKLLVSYAVVVGGLALLLCVGGLGIWWEWRAYDEARTQAAQAEVNAQLMQGLAHVELTSCGGKPCVKLDARERWGSKGEYLLLKVNR
jgi:hypothetical protein